MLSPPKLKKGDQVIILASASGVELPPVLKAKKILESFGFSVKLGKYLEKTTCYFATGKKNRVKELQKALDSPKIRAIFFARGGYGSVHLIDQLSFKKFKNNPKWLVGFSDITLFHLHLFTKVKAISIHGPMPNHFYSTPKKNLKQLFDLLTSDKIYTHKIKGKFNNKPGKAKGRLVGGNLSLLLSTLGSNSMPNLKSKILFIEEVGEYTYAIDRMLQTLKRAGCFKGLSGLVLGTFTNTKDTRPGYGKNVHQIILELFKEAKFPILFNFSCGHIKANIPFIHGAKSSIEASLNSGLLTIHC